MEQRTWKAPLVVLAAVVVSVEASRIWSQKFECCKGTPRAGSLDEITISPHKGSDQFSWRLLGSVAQFGFLGSEGAWRAPSRSLKTSVERIEGGGILAQGGVAGG